MRNKPIGAVNGPVVSIVCATFNRADVLRVAIESVRSQSVTDWELIVVGDACTDHTRDVVESFQDQRIRFTNRSENHGEQSVPNNDGVALARGGVIAYLNHDDVWLQDHLEQSLATLDQSGADIVFGGYTIVTPRQEAKRSSVSDFLNGRWYEVPPASTWLFDRSLVATVGPWQSAFDLHFAPSAKWLIEATRSGFLACGVGATTVAIIPSGHRPGSYVANSNADIDFARSLIGPGGRERLHSLPPESVSNLRRTSRATWRAVARLIAAAGLHPYAVRCRMRELALRRKRGEFIQSMRLTRGLSSTPRSKTDPQARTDT